MSGNYQPILTNAGMAADAASRVTGAAKLTIAQMVIGDGGGNPVTPQAAQTGLINPLDTFAVDSVALDPANPTVLMVTGTLPTAFAGGVVLREVGLILSNGTFYAVSAVPDTYIPLASQGAARNVQLVLKFVETNGTGNVTINANPAGWATQAWVSQQIAGLALPASEPHTFISDFNTAVQALIPPFPASETHQFISDFNQAAAAAAPVQTVNNVGPTPGTTNVELTPANIGAVNKAGDTLTGPLTLPGLTTPLISQSGGILTLTSAENGSIINATNGAAVILPNAAAGGYFKIISHDFVGNPSTASIHANSASFLIKFGFGPLPGAGGLAGGVYYMSGPGSAIEVVADLGGNWNIIVNEGGDKYFNGNINAQGGIYSTGSAQFPGGISVPTMPAGDNSTNAASTAFVTNALANAFPAGEIIAWGDSQGQAGGGTISIGSSSATFTFATARSTSTYKVVGKASGYGPQASGTSGGVTYTVGPIWPSDIIKIANVSKTTTSFTVTFETFYATDPTTSATTTATFNNFIFFVYQ